MQAHKLCLEPKYNSKLFCTWTWTHELFVSHIHLIGGRRFTFDKASFGPGFHLLEVIITTDNGGRTISILGFKGMYTMFMLLKI